MVSNLLSIIVIYLSLALSLSLSVASAIFVTDIVRIILLSTVILRLIELGLSTLSGIRGNAQLCMEVSNVILLIPAVLLECISIGFRSFSLGFRIFANVSAGHVLSDIILVARYTTLAGILSFLTHFLFSYILVIYELLVACIQLGVFVSLVTVYVD